MKRVADALAFALDTLCAWVLCAVLGAITLPLGLLVTDLAVGLLHRGHGVLQEMAPLTLRHVGLHPLAVAALLGGLVGWGYALWEEMSLLGGR